MIRNEALLQLREAYIEIGKMVQKYGYGQYNGILRILMGQVNCIDSDESDGEKMKYLIESYSKLFASRGGLITVFKLIGMALTEGDEIHVD